MKKAVAIKKEKVEKKAVVSKKEKVETLKSEKVEKGNKAVKKTAKK